MRRLTPRQISHVLLGLAGRHAPSRLAAALGAHLARQGRARDLALVRAALAETLEDQGQVTVETAQPLSAARQEDLRELFDRSLPHRSIVFRAEPALLGGVRLHAGRRVYDASIQETLRQLAATLNPHQSVS